MLRAGRTNVKRFDDRGRLVCSFNGVSTEECARMFEGAQAAICDNGVELMMTITLAEVTSTPDAICSFCGQTPAGHDVVIEGLRVWICTRCVRQFAAALSVPRPASEG